jgi:hypothetical protein
MERLGLLGLPVAAVAMLALAAPAGATGSAHIQHPDGTVKNYTGVRISVNSTSMAMTSSDGAGTVYIGKAACSKFGVLLKCLPYDATLVQHGTTTHIPLKSGTVWLNPTASSAALPNSASKLPPLGVLLTMETKGGTTVSLSGTADEVKK